MKQRQKTLTKRILGILFLCLLLPVFGAAQADEPEPQEPPQPQADWQNQGDTLEDAIESYHLDVWAVEPDELERMYGDQYVIRRQPNTREAWAVFELPYIENFRMLCFYKPSFIRDFTVLLSQDGETYEEAEPEISVTPAPDSDHWTQRLYQLSGLTRVRYLKLVWPEELDNNDWWNPYLSWLEADLGQPKATEIRYQGPETLEIPMYDSAEYQLDAYVADQLGEPMDDFPVAWEAAEPLPDGVVLTPQGLLTVDKDCVPESRLTLTAQWDDLSARVELTLAAGILGDCNHDGILDAEDLELVCGYYGKKQDDPNWRNVRLADIDRDGTVTVVDLAYIAYHCGGAPEAPPEDYEGEDSGA